MSTVFAGEDFSYSDNELSVQFEEYQLPEYDLKEDVYLRSSTVLYNWQKTPRSPADFSESKSRVSSCRDSDYEAWLDNYYAELVKEETKCIGTEKQVDTSDLVPPETMDIHSPVFPEIVKKNWTGSTKYWGPQETRRHWPLFMRRGEYLLFPTLHPHLNLSSRYGRYYSLMNSAAAVPEIHYKRFVCKSVKKTVQGLNRTHPQLLKILFCDSIFNLNWFDYMGKVHLMRSLCEFIRSQHLIEKVYFENTNLNKLEGIILLCALTKNGGGMTLKELHMWKMFAPDECPLLLNKKKAKWKHAKEARAISTFTRIHFLQILNSFTSLTHLSMNYAYLANRNGDVLLSLKSLRYGYLKELRILCLYGERPFLSDTNKGCGGCKVADGVWRRAAELCPELQVMMVFDNLPQYDDIIMFLSKSIPMSYVYISGGMDFDFRKPWNVDSTLLELRNWYAPTLETLCLHLWHHRDLLDYVIKSKILEEFPNLVTFEFIGILKNVETLESFCHQLAKGSYKLKSLLFWVEEEHTNRKKKYETQMRIKEICESYKKIFEILDIDANLKAYTL